MKFGKRGAAGGVLAVMVLLLAGACAHAQTFTGWRGNWTGSFPDAKPGNVPAG